MEWRKLPKEMRDRVAQYYEHRYKGKVFDEEAILNDLSETLRIVIISFFCFYFMTIIVKFIYKEVLNHKFHSLITSIPFFNNADQKFVSDMVTKLVLEVYQSGDYIIKEGTFGDRMYVIK